jgi:hypothetical protein
MRKSVKPIYRDKNDDEEEGKMFVKKLSRIFLTSKRIW